MFDWFIVCDKTIDLVNYGSFKLNISMFDNNNLLSTGYK